jgi:DNA-binding MarR family transcriptional regulator
MSIRTLHRTIGNIAMAPIAPATSATFTFIQASACVTEFVDARLSTVGLSIPKLAALQRLVDAGGSLPLGQLAGRLACVKSNVTQLIDRLEADGFVSREPDPSDKRSRLAVITSAGRAAWERGAALQRAAEQELLASLAPGELTALGEILEKLKARRSACSG